MKCLLLGNVSGIQEEEVSSLQCFDNIFRIVGLAMLYILHQLKLQEEERINVTLDHS